LTVIPPDLRKKSNKRKEREFFYLAAKITGTTTIN
jgi:hypothetical protein